MLHVQGMDRDYFTEAARVTAIRPNRWAINPFPVGPAMRGSKPTLGGEALGQMTFASVLMSGADGRPMHDISSAAFVSLDLGF
jgi:hypothetical protein